MVWNYLKIALRALHRQKVYTFINVLGLTVGLACVFLTLLFIRHELSFDQYHPHADRLVRVVEQYYEDGQLVEESASVPLPLGPAFGAYAGVITTRFYRTYQRTPLLRYEEQRFFEERLFFVDSTVFDVFAFPLLRGDPKTALAEPLTMVITESAARRYFGEADPMGRVLTFEEVLDFRVTGVAQDPPVNTHLPFDFLASMQNLGAIMEATGSQEDWQGWFWNPAHTYLRLPPAVPQEAVEALLAPFVQTHYPEWLREDVAYYFQAVPGIHLTSNLYQEVETNGSLRTVQIFALIAVLILLIACINFINLTTARSMQRAREVGVRKVLGAQRSHLIGQFLGESMLVSAAAAALATALAVLLLPAFGHLVGTTLPRTLAATPFFAVVVGGVALLVGGLAGAYPAVVLAAHQPVRTLRSGREPGASAALLRKGLVVTQFAVSIVLLVSTFVVYRQLQFLREKELGFDQEQLVMIPLQGTAVQQEYAAFKEAIAPLAGVVGASAMSDVVGREVTVRGFGVQGREGDVGLPGLFADADVVETLGLTVTQGRALDRRESDQGAVLVNEALVRQIDWPGEALGKRIEFFRTYAVVGVVADFHFEPLRQRVRPLVIGYEPEFFSLLAVRLAPGDARPALAALEATWTQFEPSRPFDYFFLDASLGTLYDTEERLGQVYSAFSLLAVLIACLGLFGLAAYTAERRTKEIGVRKVLGASVGSIVVLLSKDFIRLVLLAFVLAVPVGYLLIRAWLQGFAYRVEVAWWLFAGAGLVALGVALLTVSVQAVRAATSNPVDTLRTE